MNQTRGSHSRFTVRLEDIGINMTERIKELAKQAMIFSHENGGWRISTHVPNDFQEKFAELIIKECKMQVIVCASELELDANPFVDKLTEHFKD